MKVLSLFSGVGGFDMGLENAGMQTVFQCEWDKHANTILNKHWPHVPKWEDVSTLTGEHILSKAPVIDVVAWGSPCQDLSVAGKRSGLEGERSGLFHEGIRIIKELRKETNGQYPRISIWENVVGALNSNRGADFGIIINQMAEAGAMVIEWAVLDAQYFGVPQRRRRVFVIAIFDPVLAQRCPSPLLPVAESLPRHLTKSKPKRQSATSTTPEGVGSSSRMRGFGDYISDDTASAIKARDHKDATDLVIEQAHTRLLGSNIVGSLNATDYKWPQNQQLDENKFVVTEPMLIDGTRVNDVRIYEEPVQTLKERMGTGGNNVPMLAFDTQFGSNANVTENVAPTLKSPQASPSVAYPIDTRNALRDPDKYDAQNRQGLGIGADGDPMATLTPAHINAVAYSIREDAKAGNFSATELDHANSLSSLRPSPQSHHAQMFITEPTVFQPGTMLRLNGGVWEGTVPTLRAEAKRGDNEPHIQIHNAEPTMAVRRLTPLECERLMGWPDDHTRYKVDGTEQTDGHRYKQCGNGVASPVAQWIAKHLLNIQEQP